MTVAEDRSVSDRKYRQHGYQDDNRDRAPRGEGGPARPKEPRDPRMPRDPRVPNMPGFRQIFRCSRCGHVEGLEIGSASRCGGCGVALRACIHCEAFDPAARFECTEKIPARVSPKDEPNDCASFAPRIKVERETGSTRPSGQTESGAKKAFDDLFKF
jgi:hypothetical protein